MKKELITILFLAFLFNGCSPMFTIKTGDLLESPKDIKTNFIPIRAEGKETITKGTEKSVDKKGFKIEKSNLLGMQAISISRANVKVTVAHASYTILKDSFGLTGAMNHPLPKTTFTPMHVWGPYDAPAFRALYKTDNSDTYQVYDVVPFYKCVIETYRNEENKKLLEEFQKAFNEGKIRPFAYNDKRSPQEIKLQMEGLIGEPHCSAYVKNNVVFYVQIENYGDEKIRLWPVQESVIIDTNNAQYKALPQVEISKLLESWDKILKELPTGKVNPVLGIHFNKSSSNDGALVLAVVKGLSAFKSGIEKGDVIVKIDEKAILNADGIRPALSTKSPGDTITVDVLRNKSEKKFRIKLMSADQWPRPKPIKALSGGNVYPKVIYDGFLVFDTEAMLNNYTKGSVIKLIIPLIGTEFTASDTPIHSFDFEFDFEMN